MQGEAATNVIRYSDHADAVRFTLTPRFRWGSDVEIVLDLFRGAKSLSRTVVARVDRTEVDAVLRRCRHNLEQRGLKAASASQASRSPAAAADPRVSLSAAAFDWMFAAG